MRVQNMQLSEFGGDYASEEASPESMPQIYSLPPEGFSHSFSLCEKQPEWGAHQNRLSHAAIL